MFWIVLWCAGDCSIDEARRSGWRADVALATSEYDREWVEDSSAQYKTQATCLSELKRAKPAGKTGPDEYGQIDETTHYRFYVSVFSAIPYVQVRSTEYACFQTAPRLS